MKNATGVGAEEASSKWKFWDAFSFLRSKPNTEERISNLVKRRQASDEVIFLSF